MNTRWPKTFIGNYKDDDTEDIEEAGEGLNNVFLLSGNNIIQFSKNEIFNMDTYGTWANIEIVDTKEMEVEVDRSLPALSRKSAAFALVADRFIFAIGGKS